MDGHHQNSILKLSPPEIREHEIERHFHCADCNRQFMNTNNLRMVYPTILSEAEESVVDEKTLI
ncbi:hypothetical protein FOXG_08658 [Fusarium oxysporum f. sp. lycopersici 4287]|uniref:Uncharacterized protein n=2 Tax=Fusarium oxysporum TaxID=5507 RepID=A0A0J9V7L7_FUSO4|nr:hypothetical protein FOXG_08658 [Fusarium oxysporum f. sp. lycopersici 4287]KNB07529.1 hypothetical protein FOXG_08658 [Fusarium oxysporum f. sp. lycopersici 4287]